MSAACVRLLTTINAFLQLIQPVLSVMLEVSPPLLGGLQVFSYLLIL